MKKCLLETGLKRVKQSFVLLAVVLVAGCGGGSSGDSTTASDTTPNAFSFNDVTGSNASTVTTSNTINISGIDAAATVTASGNGTVIQDKNLLASCGTSTNLSMYCE